MLQANFQLDSNPDGQDLERIASVTGLSKRVTQVWFQNSRARQKKHIHAGKSKRRFFHREKPIFLFMISSAFGSIREVLATKVFISIEKGKFVQNLKILFMRKSKKICEDKIIPQVSQSQNF